MPVTGGGRRSYSTTNFQANELYMYVYYDINYIIYDAWTWKSMNMCNAVRRGHVHLYS